MIESLNSRWNRETFHRHIADLSDAADGAVVLDLGCGEGATLPYLLKCVGSNGRVVALDRNAAFLKKVEDHYSDDIKAGRLEIIQMDAETGLPFPDETFDSVICQNMLECVSDRISAIKEMKRVLHEGGRLVLGHHDFDAVILASEDRILTRRLVHGYADHTQSWQESSDGQMGRFLPGLVASCGFTHAQTETILFVDMDLAPHSYGRVYLGGIATLASKFGITQQEVQLWLQEIEGRTQKGTFYFAIPWMYVVARK